MSGISYYKKACSCGGTIRWFWYDGDCRGNDGGSDIGCLSCNTRFTIDEARERIKGIKASTSP